MQDLSHGEIMPCTVGSCIAYLDKQDVLGFDIETLGFDPYRDRIVCIQLGNAEAQFVVDVGTVDIQEFKSLLETKLLIGHNLKFDVRFLFHNRIIPSRIFDTFIAERTLYLGVTLHKASLADCVDRYCGAYMDKTERLNITGRFSPEFIKYSGTDVKYLHAIKEKQEELIKEKECKVSIELDNRFVIVLSYIEYCGMKLDIGKWLNRLGTIKNEAEQLRQQLDDYVITNGYEKFINRQGDLFVEGLSTSINWNSAAQVIQLFEMMGVDVDVVDKGVVKKTTEASQLLKQVEQFPILETYIRYKECQKNIGTYGENWIKLINPVSGRIHTSYKQLMSTGRLSSGGRDKATGEAYPNFQNIPSDEETRGCFVAEEGNILIGCDYTGQEQIVLVNKCLDENLLEFYRKDLGDMHSFVASKMYPELDGVPLDEIKKKHKDKRQAAKVAGFAINYGGSGKGIAEQLNLTLEQGTHIYESYFNAFPGLKSYFDRAKQFGLKNGYVLISEVTGKKSYVDNYDWYMEQKKRIDNNAFWEGYKKHKASNTPTFRELKKAVQAYSMKKGEIERMSLNYPIQGESSEITKLSCVLFWNDYLVPNNLLFTVKFVNTIHDENLIECPQSLAEECANALQQAMEKAGSKFCKTISLKADPCIAPFWKK
jgi:DNA polymerase I-like protein with 3'-5' exonuclease and polymerase domains